MDGFQVYHDIAKRTNGEIYLGVCGPVRSGKSTFIKRFMELFVIPGIADVHEKERAIDELPQSADGKTIMTTEPKFIPKEAARVKLYGDNEVKIRLIDCVGYIVNGAEGLLEDGKERMVMTPWSDQPMPFTKAAEYGTKKVIYDHSTIGIVMTADGSFGDFSRQDYEEAEARTISELKKIGKPFIVILNSTKPYSEETKQLKAELEQKYGIPITVVDCNQLQEEDIKKIFEEVISSFPVNKVSFYLPKWVEMLPPTHWLKEELVEKVRGVLDKISLIRDVTKENFHIESDTIQEFKISHIAMETGEVVVHAQFDEGKYFQILSELVGLPIDGEYQLIQMLREYAEKKEGLSKITNALNEVKRKGYGVITPSMKDIDIAEPELIRHGNKYGVKLKATSPSVHMIQANIETEIAPIVGSEEQAKDLITYISEQGKKGENGTGIWDTNIFGKTVRQLVEEGMESKVSKLTEESQLKLQDTIQKVVNDSNGGLVCIII